MKMTPGPWDISPMNPSLICAGHVLVALVLRHLNNGEPDGREANARLIAAAPELLSALQDAATRLEACAALVPEPHQVRALIAYAQEARAVIARALL